MFSNVCFLLTGAMLNLYKRRFTLWLKFDLIMISDHMDESLILMKNELGLSMDDIVYFSINKRFRNFVFRLTFSFKIFFTY